MQNGKRLIYVFWLVLAWGALAWSAVIHVPADQPTIQAGLDHAGEADTVQVAPG